MTHVNLMSSQQIMVNRIYVDEESTNALSQNGIELVLYLKVIMLE